MLLIMLLWFGWLTWVPHMDNQSLSIWGQSLNGHQLTCMLFKKLTIRIFLISKCHKNKIKETENLQLVEGVLTMVSQFMKAMHCQVVIIFCCVHVFGLLLVVLPWPVLQSLSICRHPPNLDSVKWLKDNIWPLLRKKVPEGTELHVYGAYGGSHGVQALNDKVWELGSIDLKLSMKPKLNWLKLRWIDFTIHWSL